MRTGLPQIPILHTGDPNLAKWSTDLSRQLMSGLSNIFTDLEELSKGVLPTGSETDPVFLASPANSISNINIANWNAAYNWGNHTNYVVAYSKNITLPLLESGKVLTNNGSELLWTDIIQYSDSAVRSSISSSATGLDYNSTTGILSLTSGYIIPTVTEESNWNAAYGWGNPSGVYLPLAGGTVIGQITSTYPTASGSPFAITSTIVNTNLNADLLDGNHAAAFLTSVTAHNLLSTTHGDTLTASPVLGDVMIGNATPAWARLAGQITTTRKFLRQTGTSTISALPVWDTVTATDVGLGSVTNNAQYYAGGADVAVADGGTGLSAWTANGIVYASGTTVLANNANCTFIINATATLSELLCAGNLSAGAFLKIPTTTSTVGQILQNSVCVFHTFYPTNYATNNRNVFLGFSVGNFTLSNDAATYKGTGNVGIGQTVMTALTTGYYNFAAGLICGNSLTTGTSNCFLGTYAGGMCTTGSSNFFLGREAGYSCKTTENNIAIGAYALAGPEDGVNYLGSYNTAIGAQAGKMCYGGLNIFIGYSAGYRQTTASNLLIVDDCLRADQATELSNAILYGVMSTTPAGQTLTINAATTVSLALLGTTTIEATTGFKCGGTAGIDATVTYVDTLLGAKTLTFKKGILTAQT